MANSSLPQEGSWMAPLRFAKKKNAFHLDLLLLSACLLCKEKKNWGKNFLNFFLAFILKKKKVEKNMRRTWK